MPYWEAIQNAESDLSHVTASVRGHEYHASAPLGRGHLPMHGFDANTYLSDTRFRLATALRAAGLQNSEAARVAVAKFNPRPHLAIHGIV